MGYRSEVSLTIFENDYKTMLKNAHSNEDIFDFLTKYPSLFRNGDIVTIYWNCVKWYEEYSDVGFVVDFMRSGIKYRFVRVGEENGDIEEESNDDDWEFAEIAYPVCSIAIDGSTEEDIDGYLQTIDFTHNSDEVDSEEEQTDNSHDEEFYKLLNT